jgi:hypothetical protein
MVMDPGGVHQSGAPEDARSVLYQWSSTPVHGSRELQSRVSTLDARIASRRQAIDRAGTGDRDVRVVRGQTFCAEWDLELAAGETYVWCEFPGHRGVHYVRSLYHIDLKSVGQFRKRLAREDHAGAPDLQPVWSPLLVGEAALDVTVYLKLRLPAETR